MGDHDLAGLVLAGGASRRMNRDKAAIPTDGVPQVRRIAELLARFCTPVIVSVGAGRAQRALYRGLQTVEDKVPDAGPLSGIVSTHLKQTERALVVIAVDLFGVDEAVIAALLRGRALALQTVNSSPPPAAVALAADDGGPEPLCAIWEPALLSAARVAFASGERSARSVMVRSDVYLVGHPGGSLWNVNTSEELRAFRQTAHPTRAEGG